MGDLLTFSTEHNTYEGEDRGELYADMYERGGLTFQSIADFYGISRAAVGFVFKRLGKARLKEVKKRKPYWARIKELSKSKMSDEEIAALFDSPQRRTIIHIHKFRKPPSRPNMGSRQKRLIETLFNTDAYAAGPKFNEFIEQHLPIVDNKSYQKILKDYYIRGKQNERHKRGVALRKFASHVNDDPEVLIEKEVLIAS